ncbi:vesicle-associated protein 3-1-like [Silene latifolia]|uniref:vesicle-associated protein 3-1-like n=1 Tax=Silene latifolia TaxID=37657 RepID=UPI003D783800
MNTKFLHVQPSDQLKFPFQLNRLSTCSLQLTNISTDHNIAFKVKTTHPKKYCVRPNIGIISPSSTCVVKVYMQAQKVIPPAIPKNKFLIQSMIAPDGLTSEKITSQMFREETANLKENKLRVVFVTTISPSPIPEGSVEECCIEVSELEKQDRKIKISTLLDSVKRYGHENDGKKFRGWDIVLKLIEEKFCLVLENQQLQYDAEIVRQQIKNVRSRNVVILVTVSVWLLGFVFGMFLTP